MCAELLPKDFEKTTEVLPFTKYGLSSIEEFRKAEEEVHHQEWLKKAGLTSEEIKLYQENEAGLLDQRKKIESSALKKKLEAIYNKINNMQNDVNKVEDVQPGSSSKPDNIIEHTQKKPLTLYPEGHPMNELKQLEKDLFGCLDADILPITKRRKMLRRLERKKQRVLQINIAPIPSTSKVDRLGSLWDVKEITPRSQKPVEAVTHHELQKRIIGPKEKTMYTIKDNKIVRLERLREEINEFKAVDIVVPENAAEEQLLEGTKMCIDDIKKIDRFKDYNPGVPSKVLYLKNIAPSVTEEQVLLLFNQFVLANGAPVDVKFFASGRMRGQAFATFNCEAVAMDALNEINGTILGGRPIIAVFGRPNQRALPDDDR